MGEGSDGERTHRCHRRCGRRGQPPPSRSWPGICLGTTGWTTCARDSGGCGRLRVVTRRDCPCTVRAHARPQVPVGNFRDADPRIAGSCGVVAGGWPSRTGRRGCPRRRLWTTPGVLVTHFGTDAYPQDCPQPVDLWTTLGMDADRGEVTTRSRWTHRVGRSLWISSDPVVWTTIHSKIDRRIQGDRGQPACCLMRFVSSVTWL